MLSRCNLTLSDFASSSKFEKCFKFWYWSAVIWALNEVWCTSISDAVFCRVTAYIYFLFLIRFTSSGTTFDSSILNEISRGAGADDWNFGRRFPLPEASFPEVWISNWGAGESIGVELGVGKLLYRKCSISDRSGRPDQWIQWSSE